MRSGAGLGKSERASAIGWEADIALLGPVRQFPSVASIVDDWWNEERRDLARSLMAIASEASSPERIGLCLDTILNDLELYGDPRQGEGRWLCENELQLADQFGVQLHNTVSSARLVDAGVKAIASPGWADVRATAARLLRLMEANGDFTP